MPTAPRSRRTPRLVVATTGDRDSAVAHEEESSLRPSLVAHGPPVPSEYINMSVS